MGKIIAVANQKGGVGKTTTAVNLSAALAETGKKVLMADLDPQGNTTSGLGGRVTERNSIYDAMMGRTSLQNCIQGTEIKKLRLIGADIRLAGNDLWDDGIERDVLDLQLQAELLSDGARDLDVDARERIALFEFIRRESRVSRHNELSFSFFGFISAGGKRKSRNGKDHKKR